MRMGMEIGMRMRVKWDSVDTGVIDGLLAGYANSLVPWMNVLVVVSPSEQTAPLRLFPPAIDQVPPVTIVNAPRCASRYIGRQPQLSLKRYSKLTRSQQRR